MMTMAAGQKKYQIVLVRHGESTWNDENRFTGWYDCPLSVKGLQEAKEAGKILKVRKERESSPSSITFSPSSLIQPLTASSNVFFLSLCPPHLPGG